MAFDEALAVRVRQALAGATGVTEKRMFGGLAFMRHGHVFVGVVDSTLMARVGPADYEASLARPHVREMDFTGKPMRCMAFVGTLPKKVQK